MIDDGGVWIAKQISTHLSLPQVSTKPGINTCTGKVRRRGLFSSVCAEAVCVYHLILSHGRSSSWTRGSEREAKSKREGGCGEAGGRSAFTRWGGVLPVMGTHNPPQYRYRETEKEKEIGENNKETHKSTHSANW